MSGISPVKWAGWAVKLGWMSWKGPWEMGWMRWKGGLDEVELPLWNGLCELGNSQQMFWAGRAHPAQQKVQLQANDFAGFLFGFKPRNLIDTGVLISFHRLIIHYFLEFQIDFLHLERFENGWSYPFYLEIKSVSVKIYSRSGVSSHIRVDPLIFMKNEYNHQTSHLSNCRKSI
jgi:hypothetical protein